MEPAEYLSRFLSASDLEYPEAIIGKHVVLCIQHNDVAVFFPLADIRPILFALGL
jgi:hypothetical protein